MLIVEIPENIYSYPADELYQVKSMAYDKKTNREAVRAYSHPAVSEYIPRNKNKKIAKPSLLVRIKRFLHIK